MIRALAALALVGALGCGGEPEESSVEAPPPPTAAELTGDYELLWVQHPGQPRLEMPEAAIGTLEGCIWARWGWRFESDGRLSISNEMLCRAPAELGAGYGACRAGFETRVRWREGGFELPMPIRGQSRFVNLRPTGDSYASATVLCNVSVGALDATLEDVEGGSEGSPQLVTMALADGGQMRLRRLDDADIDHARLIAELGGADAPTAPEPAPGEDE